MEQTSKKLVICLITVVLAAIAMGLFYWYAGGAGLADDAVLVFEDGSGVFRWLG